MRGYISHQALGSALLAVLLLAGCPAAQMTVSAPQIADGMLSLQVKSPDRNSQPLFDRVDLLLLQSGPDELPQSYESSTAYFNAIREGRGFYMGGDYLDDSERESGEAIYELDLPDGTIPPEDCSAWLVCLSLEGTAIEIQDSIPISDWP